MVARFLWNIFFKVHWRPPHSAAFLKGLNIDLLAGLGIVNGDGANQMANLIVLSLPLGVGGGVAMDFII